MISQASVHSPIPQGIPFKCPSICVAAGRAFALFSGLYLLASLVQMMFGSFGLHHWLIHFDALEQWPWIVGSVLGISSMHLIAFAWKPNMKEVRQVASAGIFLFLAGIAALNALEYFSLLQSARILSVVPLPLSLGTFLGFLTVLAATLFPKGSAHSSISSWQLGIASVVLLCSFPLLQMLFFGMTDYRRSADAAIVLGARAYANGEPSDALKDRLNTACQLYRSGLVKVLVMSGGPGDGDIHETEAMRRYANRQGIPNEAIIIDEKGLNTAASIHFLADMEQRGFRSFLAVSHAYHLPRIKMYAQKSGLQVYTVPAQTPRVLAKLPYFMLRESAAWWSYFFAPA